MEDGKKNKESGMCSLADIMAQRFSDFVQLFSTQSPELDGIPESDIEEQKRLAEKQAKEHGHTLGEWEIAMGYPCAMCSCGANATVQPHPAENGRVWFTSMNMIVDHDACVQYNETNNKR